jgi:hypothetical protein
MLIKVLINAGIWQKKSSSWTYFCYGIVVHLIFIDLYFLLQFAYLFTFETFEDFALLMTMCPTCFAFAIQSLTLMSKIDEIEWILTEINQIAKEENFSEKFQKPLKLIDSIFKVFCTATFLCCTFGLGIPFINHELPYKMWFPFDYKNNELLFWLSVIYQGIDSMCFSIIDIVLDVMPAMFMCYIIGMLEELCDRLESMTIRDKDGKSKTESFYRSKQKIASTSKDSEGPRSDSEAKNRQEFLKCLKLHSKILEISMKVEKLFSIVIMVQGMAMTLVVCTTMYALTVVSLTMTCQSPWFLFESLLDLSNQTDSNVHEAHLVLDPCDLRILLSLLLCHSSPRLV